MFVSPAGQTQSAPPPPVVRDKLPGPFRFPDEPFLRLVGKVVVLDAHTLRFSDGTEIEMNGTMDAPDLNQKSVVEGVSFSCGHAAADFLRKLIGDHEVTCLADYNKNAGKIGGRFGAACFVNEVNLQIEMVRNGWAIAHHSAMEPWEAIARQNHRGLWRGRFVAPEKWRKGERLPRE